MATQLVLVFLLLTKISASQVLPQPCTCTEVRCNCRETGLQVCTCYHGGLSEVQWSLGNNKTNASSNKAGQSCMVFTLSETRCSTSNERKTTWITSTVTVIRSKSIKTTTTVQVTPTTEPSQITTPTCSPTNTVTLIDKGTSAALGVITGILVVTLVTVIAGWVWTYFVMRKRQTKLIRETAVRYRADEHQQPHINTLSSDRPNVEPDNDDYAEVADRLATIHTSYLHREQQPVPRQSRRESTKPLIENEYQIQEQNKEREGGVDHDYQILEDPDENAQEGNTENYYDVLECKTKPNANETAVTDAALYEVLN